MSILSKSALRLSPNELQKLFAGMPGDASIVFVTQGGDSTVPMDEIKVTLSEDETEIMLDLTAVGTLNLFDYDIVEEDFDPKTFGFGADDIIDDPDWDSEYIDDDRY